MLPSFRRVRETNKALLYAFSSIAFIGVFLFLAMRLAPGQAQKSSVAPEQPKSINANNQLWLSIFPWGEKIFEIQSDVRNPDTIYASTSHGLFKTSNAGMSWLPSFLIEATDLTFAQSKSSPNVMYIGASFGQRGSLLKSTDGGGTWQPV